MKVEADVKVKNALEDMSEKSAEDGWDTPNRKLNAL
jgi:hypothetical protein